jgi:hypothetical protein
MYKPGGKSLVDKSIENRTLNIFVVDQEKWSLRKNSNVRMMNHPRYCKVGRQNQ